MPSLYLYTKGFQSVEPVQQFLSSVPLDASIAYELEPYTAIQSRASIKAFQTLIDDPRFIFDDVFVARSLYFSTRQLHAILTEDPRFPALVKAKPRFYDYFEARYAKAPQGTRLGMSQRYIQASRVIDLWNKKKQKEQNQRLLFVLYPALTFAAHAWKERYYAPGAKGFLKSQERFYKR